MSGIAGKVGTAIVTADADKRIRGEIERGRTVFVK